MVSRHYLQRGRGYKLTVPACNNTLLYGNAVQLFYKPKLIEPPATCLDVELVVEMV